MSSRAIPPLNHPDRMIFERAYKTGNHILTASLSQDECVRHLQRHINGQPTLNLVNLRSRIADIQGQSNETLDKIYANGKESWNEYFRLVSQTTFLEQRVMIPYAFYSDDDNHMLEYLANGIYGLNGAILEQELVEYNNRRTKYDRDTLSGAIHEQTAMALINRGDFYSHFALPSTTGDDMQRRIDIDYWRLHDDQSTLEHIPIQVKRTVYKSSQSVAPTNGITITAADLGNYHLEAAYLIVKELNNELVVDEEAGINEKAELDMIQKNFAKIINRKYNTVSHLGHSVL